MQIRIYYEDTDCGGIVYHANYLKFAERARSELFFARGMKPEVGGYSFVVRNIQARFLAPAKLGDLVWVGAIPIEIRGASLKLLQEVRLGDAEGKELALLEVEVVCLKEGKVARIPEDFYSLFGEQE